jgi:hypothetical protein
MKFMRRLLGLAACAVLAAAAGAAGRSGGGSTRVFKQRHVSVSRPSGDGRGVSGRQNFRAPSRDENGARISAHAARYPGHASIVGNGALVGRISDRERLETTPGRYYWHNDGGVRYCHYYWGGAHWYGFYAGPSFYWTRYYGSRWWWYDAHFARWTFWWDGYWWWGGPGGAYYVWVNDGYYPYDPEAGAVTVQTAEEQRAPEKAPAAGAGSLYPSPDGARQVQVYGADAQAFLYDKTGSEPQFMKFLGQGVDKVRYTGGASGKPVQILLEFKDGTFAVYDEDGNSVDASAASNASTTGTADGKNIPGPPPGAPPTPPANPTSTPSPAPTPGATKTPIPAATTPPAVTTSTAAPKSP